MTEPLTVEDDLAIRRTLALFSHVFDNGRHDLLHLVFTDDMVLENTVGNGFVHNGIDEAAQFTRNFQVGTVDHHTVDSVIWRDVGGTVRARSRYLATVADGAVHGGDYFDELVRTSEGWRIRYRLTVPRIPPFERRPVSREFLEQWDPDTIAG
ncbi:nuclear transport factor 2 family protein [Rhodococcoides yunnanense]|uniref:nuclear transport factor 2 family protein n=1 Tax=Rhodococcoides yunnanense TaxID=278209 RepID=UPI000934A8C5|nr:nuclear transport factor 2 family protein [Rhodococcus yunnanensis]